MKRIVLPNNITNDYLQQNLGKTTCPKCGAQKDVHRPIKKIRELQNKAGIHNFTLKGEDGHTTCIYWDYNQHDEIPIRVYATPNYSEARAAEDNLIEQDNFIAFALHLKDQPMISNKVVKIDGEITVERYLKEVRNFIEKHAVWARNSDGDLVEGDKVY